MSKHDSLFQRLSEAILTSPGKVQPAIRSAIRERAAAVGAGTAPQPQGVPPELAPYIAKVSLHAYRVTDADVQSLLALGYSEDAIFEVTLCAALGAGMERLERGMKALEGGSDAAQVP
jgi:alkylhydroperoxidase family enzyme